MLGEGFKGSKVGEKEIERENKEEEGRKERSRCYRIATVIIPYIVLLLCVPHAIVG